jgi:hypothetical protein
MWQPKRHAELGAHDECFPCELPIKGASVIRTASILLVGMMIVTGQARAAPYLGERSVREFHAATPLESVRCYGHHCRARVYGYRVRGHRSRWHTEDPRHMRTGSRRWWNAKDREGSTGRP